MASLDIGIDLGTATVVIYVSGKGIVLKEPSVVALNTRSGKIIGIGSDAHRMLGRTPSTIQAVRPLHDGVISDYEMTQEMMKYFLKKVCGGSIIKPRVAICVPSGITGVESRAVVDAAVIAGARKVYLIEEPVAAAIGAGIDISKPKGVLVIDIGGGTTDIAMLSLNGIVCKTSIKIAGDRLDHEIIRYIRAKHDVLIGDRMAEKIKIEVASLSFDDPERTIEARGRNLITGLPQKFNVTRGELYPIIRELCLQLAQNIQALVERTPPELVGDLHGGGAVLTGGGSMLHGLRDFFEEEIKISAEIAANPVECVATGTGRAFEYLDTLYDGFVNPSTHIH